MDAEFKKKRDAFVAMIKEENFYADFCKQSLKQCWSGAKDGFADHQVQSRWRDLAAGWDAKGTTNAK